jgi:hypothetical protein
MNNMKQHFLVFGIFLFGISLFGFPAMAQSCKTLDQILQEFSGTNNELITLKAKLNIQYKLYQNQLDKWKPTAKLDVELPYSNSIESVISGDGNVNYLKRNYLNPLLSVSTSKKIPFTGGEIGINGSLGLFQNFINSNKQYNANWFNIYISQPLFAYNNFKFEQAKQRIELSIDSIKFYHDKETKLTKLVSAILDYEIAKQKIEYNEQLSKQANYSLQRIKTLYQNGRALAEDTMLLSYSINKAKLEYEKLNDDIKAKKEFLSTQLNRTYKNTICDLMEVPILKIDTTELKQRYIKYSFQKELLLDSFEVFENSKKIKKSHGLNTTISAGIGANQTSTNVNQLFTNPSQRQNVTLNTSVPITGWKTYKRNNEIALIEQQNYQRGRQDIQSNSNLWTTEMYNQYKYLLKSFQLTKTNLSNLENLSNSVYKRFEMGKVPFTDYNNVVNEISTIQQSQLEIIKQLYLLRFNLREKTLYDWSLEKEVF